VALNASVAYLAAPQYLLTGEIFSIQREPMVKGLVVIWLWYIAQPGLDP